MGEVFAGRYELVDPIGRGGVGAVWRTWDHRRRRYVAAKVLLQSDAHSLLRFVREQALRIDHPHVLAPTSWAADDDKVLFTMDLVRGGSLVHLVGDYGPLPPAFVCTLLDQLLSGLAAVHAEGVVHRDVKPANVLLEATGTGRPRLRLSDFGIAMRLGEPRLTETNLVVGTPGYLAPEQMMGAEPDFPADLFAVGLVALYLLEGAKPDSKALVQHFAEHGTPGAPKGVPEPLWQVVASLLQPDPQARFRTATGARKALAAAAELLPEPGPDDELIEIFDQLGPLPPGFGPEGPLKPARGLDPRAASAGAGTGSGATRASAASAVPQVSGASSASDGSQVSGASSASDGSQVSDVSVSSPPPKSPAEDIPSRVGEEPVPSPSSTGAKDSGPSAGADAPVSAQGPASGTGPSATPPVPVPPPSAMSDTGSFHLPPPPAHQAPSQPPPPSQPQPSRNAEHHPAPASPFDPTHHLRSPEPHRHPYPPAHPGQAPYPAPQRRADASTASYTAQVPRVPPPAQAVARHRADRRRRRPGPPARVAVPVLLLALACYAVGFWALTRL
ncbi:protein kinase [Streptomyces sp. NPDC052701]|uniref:protein kinase domain-containing protein n=1 Tax=Streptomyces sp. NPDC052701 TaxID=3155533 RepID=UPI0034282006